MAYKDFTGQWRDEETGAVIADPTPPKYAAGSLEDLLGSQLGLYGSAAEDKTPGVAGYLRSIAEQRGHSPNEVDWASLAPAMQAAKNQHHAAMGAWSSTDNVTIAELIGRVEGAPSWLSGAADSYQQTREANPTVLQDIATEKAEWDEQQKDDDLFGSLLPVVLIGAAIILGPEILAGMSAGEGVAADIIAAELAGQGAAASWVTGYEGVLAAEGLSGAATAGALEAAAPAAAEVSASGGGLLSTPTAQVASGGQFALPSAAETAAASLSDAAAVGFTPGETAALSAGTNPAAGYVGGALAPNNLLTNAATQVGKEALTSSLTGQDFDLGDVATGMIGSVAGGATTAGVGNALASAGTPAPITNAIASGTGAGVNAAVTGGAIGNAMLGTGVASGVTTGLIGATNPDPYSASNPDGKTNNEWASTTVAGPFTAGELAGTAGQVAGSMATGTSFENALAQGAGSLAGNAAGDFLADLGVDRGVLTDVVGNIVSGAVTSGLSDNSTAVAGVNNTAGAEDTQAARYLGTPVAGRMTSDTGEGVDRDEFVSRAVRRAQGLEDGTMAPGRATGLIGRI